MFGIAPYHIAILCENSWSGGKEYTPSQCGDMTPDQIYFALADKKNLRKGSKRAKPVDSGDATALADKDGFIKGRADDGTQIKAQIKGKSLAQKLWEEEEKRLAAEAQAKEQSKQKKRRGR